jgi:hypothetical protein
MSDAPSSVPAEEPIQGPREIYPNLDRIREIERDPGHTLKDIQEEYLRQARVIIPLLKNAGRIEECVFWAGFVAFCTPKRTRR